MVCLIWNVSGLYNGKTLYMVATINLKNSLWQRLNQSGVILEEPGVHIMMITKKKAWNQTRYVNQEQTRNKNGRQIVYRDYSIFTCVNVVIEQPRHSTSCVPPTSGPLLPPKLYLSIVEFFEIILFLKIELMISLVMVGTSILILPLSFVIT